MPSHPIDALLGRLRDHGGADGPDAGDGRDRRIEAEARALVAEARELGCLIEAAGSFPNDASESPFAGTEHCVEPDFEAGHYAKITRPPGFGLVPFVNRLPVLRADPSKPSGWRDSLEFREATPTEYLVRWAASNLVFGDDVRLASVVVWEDRAVSIVVTQPAYHGVPAEMRDIERYFLEAGWERLREPDGHLVFYNFAFGVIAVDAAPRNCYINAGGLQPFDVILCEPDDALCRHLGIV